MAKLVIGTELKTDKFEKQVSALEKKYANKKIDIDVTTKELSEAESKLNEINNELDRRIAREKQIRANIEEENSKQYKSNSLISMYKEQLSAVTSEQIKLYDDWDKQNLVVEKISGRLEKQKNDLSEISSKIDGINLHQTDIGIKNIGSGIKKILGNVIKWGLAVFSIRSAYMAVRNAINVISQNDEQLKADIDYIKNVLAFALEPIVRRIIDLAKQLVFYIGYLIRAWTGYDIFANANKNLKKSVGSAKELKKQLAGFDEMNVLSDTNGGGGGVSPSFNFGDKKAPKWLQLVAKYGKKLLPIILAIIGKLAKIKGLGIAVALYGIYTTIKNIVDFIHNPSFTSFVGILEGIALTILGIGTAIGAWPAIIAGVLSLVVIELVKNFDNIMGKFQQLKEWLDKNVLAWLKEHLGKVGEFLYIPIKVAVGIVEDLFEGLIGGIKRIIEGIVKIFKGDFVGGIKDIFSGLLSIILAPFKAWYDAVSNWLYSVLELFGLVHKAQGGNSFGYGGSMGGRAKGGIYYPKLAIGGIINQPGRGVPYHGATIGERGAEAVVPLTDSQQMALLGEAIGRYVNINATVPVYVGNRMVAREMKRINAEDNFAYNR